MVATIDCTNNYFSMFKCFEIADAYKNNKSMFSWQGAFVAGENWSPLCAISRNAQFLLAHVSSAAHKVW
jgi:hypothetical protein